MKYNPVTLSRLRLLESTIVQYIQDCDSLLTTDFEFYDKQIKESYLHLKQIRNMIQQFEKEVAFLYQCSEIYYQ